MVVESITDSLSLVWVGVSGDVDPNETVSSVGRFLFFFGKIALTTFDAFRFSAPAIFVEPFVDPSDLREAGMFRGVGFFFISLLFVVYGLGQNSETVQFRAFAGLVHR